MIEKIKIQELTSDNDLINEYSLTEFIEEMNLSPELRCINDYENYFKIKLED